MHALPKLRKLFGAGNVQYDSDEDGEQSPYYKITLRGAVPDYIPNREEGENVANRKALGDAIRLELVDFILGKRQRTNEESISLLDSSTGDYARYDFEFQIPAENLEDIEQLPLSRHTKEQAESFTNPETLLEWMGKQKTRNAVANRMLFGRSDDDDSPQWGL